MDRPRQASNTEDEGDTEDGRSPKTFIHEKSRHK